LLEFSIQGPLARRVPFHLVPEFVQGDSHQQTPEIATPAENKTAVTSSDEETAIGGLDHVLRIEVPGQLGGQPAPRQCHQPLRIAQEQFFRGLLIAALPAHYQIGRSIVHNLRFAWALPTSSKDGITDSVSARIASRSEGLVDSDVVFLRLRRLRQDFKGESWKFSIEPTKADS